MKSCDISPEFYSVSSYNCFFSEKSAKNMSQLKTQYVYRALYFTNGAVEINIGGETETCRAGDVLFLVPGEEYSFNVTEDFSLINLFFDLESSNSNASDRVSSCVFKEDFIPSLCSKKPYISDGAALRHNRVFKNAGCGHLFSELLSSNKDGIYFELFAKIAISQLIYNLLVSEERKKNQGAEKIISYINMNATENLSAELLEKKFGYHRNYINKLLKDETGRTLTQCIRRSKINYAKTLLTEAKIPQSQIAAELGYYDYSHFYKAFVSETGMSPADIA